MHSKKVMLFLSAAILSMQMSVSAAIGTVTADVLNIRSEANTYCSVAGQVYSGDKVDITGRVGDFYEIYHNGTTAYVYGEYVIPEVIANGSVSVDLLNIRAGAGTGFEVIGKLAYGDGVAITDVDGEWYQITLGNGFGYVHSGYIYTASSVSRRSSAPSRSGLAVSRNRTSLVEYSKNFLGTPYASGGASPAGFDCSGFTYYVYQQHGVTLPRTSSAQAGVGVSVSRNELIPGDLVFFDTYGGISHVGIYVGGNSFIHSTVPGDVVKISSLDSSYYSSRYVTARRILN